MPTPPNRPVYDSELASQSRPAKGPLGAQSSQNNSVAIGTEFNGFDSPI
jgi:hypothetical protein